MEGTPVRTSSEIIAEATKSYTVKTDYYLCKKIGSSFIWELYGTQTVIYNYICP
jgi:GH18 family chitinase